MTETLLTRRIPHDSVFDSTIDGTNCEEELCDLPSQFEATLK